MTQSKTIYGWVKDDKAYLSRFDASLRNRPANQYASKDDAEAEAKRRGLAIKWEDE